ncbi:hypothetical protein QOT17_002448 [Balamuthia mandrillaris]
MRRDGDERLDERVRERERKHDENDEENNDRQLHSCLLVMKDIHEEKIIFFLSNTTRLKPFLPQSSVSRLRVWRGLLTDPQAEDGGIASGLRKCRTENVEGECVCPVTHSLHEPNEASKAATWLTEQHEATLHF